MQCDGNYSITWTGVGNGSSMDFHNSLCSSDQPDQFAHGIWANKPTKFAVLLWRLRWGLLNSFRVLRWWRWWAIHIPDLCLLCAEFEETIGHLFNCAYSEGALSDITSATDNAPWNIASIPPLNGGGHIRIGDVMEAIEKVSKSLNCWRLL